MSFIYFISHPEVTINPKQEITQWPLSDVGKQRMKELLSHPWIQSIKHVFSSTEQKAIDAAEILTKHLHLECIHYPELGEIDRSATGFLPREEFEHTADEFFASPTTSIRGWEKAVDAQKRIRGIIEQINKETPVDENIAIISHGGVGALYLSYLKKHPITRLDDQPGEGGGNFFVINRKDLSLACDWTSIERAELACH